MTTNPITKTRVLLCLVGLVAALAASCTAQTYPGEATHLAGVLEIGPGSQVAEIGAGYGEVTLQVARIVGANGRVYSTEIDRGKLVRIRQAVERTGAKNIAVIEGAADKTNLPANCCDAIFMRRVFHHFTQPKEIEASLFASLRPGGRLAVIDFGPGGAPRRLTGMPENRERHGIARDAVRRELKAAGFVFVSDLEGWGGNLYCLVFRKPAAR